jgi:shikimate dehydrogenase
MTTCRIDGKTRVVAVIGDPIEHTLSPAMHNAGFEALGLNWVYVAAHVDADDVGGAVGSVRALRLAGMNVTVPHKQAVMPHLDELTPAAEAVGAVNTIINRDGTLTGDNSDVVGIIRAVELGAEMTNWPEHVVLLGAGGAARGVVYALTTIETVRRVTILNRTADKAVALASEFSGDTRVEGAALDREHAEAAMADTSLVINVTSLGRGDLADMTPLPDEWDCLHAGLVCVDSNYAPPVTRLMRQVTDAGGKACNGLDMLLHQGARSFELWTEQTAPLDAMREALSTAH